MFDKGNRSINGVNIPSNVVIICLDDARIPITDPAVISRFEDAYNLSFIANDNLSTSTSQETIFPIEFDGEGEENWQAKLLGRLVVNGQLIEFKQSQLITDLETLKDKGEVKDVKVEFKFKNFSAKQQSEISILFAQARVQGFIDYHGYKIKFPKNYSLQFDKTEFNFTEILQSFKSSSEIVDGEASSGKLDLVIHKNSQPITDDVKIVNSYLFDQLLAMPKIEDDKYQEQVGLIEGAKNLTLKLFITEQLTPSQLYCLMFNARKHHVNLELYLGQGVKFDDQVFSKFNKISTTPQVDHSALTPASSPSRITITNNVEEEFNNLKALLTASDDTKHKAINIVNIEDVLFSDLFSKPEFITIPDDQSRHFTFEQKISEVKTKLDAQEIVVLKGKFPKDLLSLLHPQILDLKKQYPNLYFIIEEQEINLSSQASTQLAWLDRKKYSIKYHPKKQLEKIQIEREDPACIENEIPQDSRQQAQDFITRRKTKLKELLSRNSALQIIGHSGVGKSSLLHEVKRTGFENAGDVEITEELENFEKWASDTSNKTKILVIDEFNVDGSLNFTMFSDLVNAKNDSDNSRRKIFYKGKFYQLDQHHKVVFLGNPHNYGNRYKHQLFSDCQIQEWQLKDFPQSYIYENILKEPIFDKLGQKIKQQLGDGDDQKALENFKRIAVEAIRKYYENNTKKTDDESDLPQETVRELQERVLQEIVKKTQKNITQKVANDHFISTQVNQETISQLQTAVKIRQLQKQGDFPRESLGTPGVIFEGDSGVGKSVMIEAVLKNQGIKKITDFDSLKHANSFSSAFQSSDQESQSQYFYYKIDASLSHKEIKAKLIQAFELGVIVVIDELNTRINEGLEKEINSLLTGQHPTNPQITMKPGFMIITSVNKASSAGRANFSSAIKRRCTNISAPHLKQYQVDDIVEIMVNWAKNDPSIQTSSLKLIKTIAQKFQLLAKRDSKFNLRSLRSKFNEIKDRLIIFNDQYSQQDLFQNPNLQLMHFKENTNLKFFSTSSHDLQNPLDNDRETNSNFHFRDTNPQANDPKTTIFQALKGAQDQLAISDDDMMQFSILAVKHQGLGNVFGNVQNKQKIEEDFQKLFGENWQEKKSQAIEFSAEFQRKLEEKNILTGRRDPFREVGMRLKRLDPELLLEFLLKDHDDHSLKREFIKDNFVNKLNKILATNNKSLEDSIKTLISQGNQGMGLRR